MPLSPFLDDAAFVLLKAARTKRDAVIKLHVGTDPARLTNHKTRTVIDEEVASDFGSRMNVDPGSTMRPLRHDSGYQRQLFPVKDMSDSLYRDGLYAGISDRSEEHTSELQS